MKRGLLLILVVGAQLAPLALSAQVDKRVEVSKTYVPSVGHATKLSLRPDMTDTVRIRPEIDYSITPQAFSTPLSTRPIRPATVTYWEFNRPAPVYLKLGAGYPLNTVGDLYVATQHSDIGYALGYVNHHGQFAKIREDAVLRNATRMFNRIGAAAGRYVGRHTLEADLSYTNRFYRRYEASPVGFDDDYDQYASAEWGTVGRRIDFGQADLKLRFGDDFVDLSRLNFDLSVNGTYFYDDTENATSVDDRQIDAGARLKLGRRFGRHTFLLGGGFDGMWGQGDLKGYETRTYSGMIRYRYASRKVDLAAGLDYYHTDIAHEEYARAYHVAPDTGIAVLSSDNGIEVDRYNYFLPFLHLRFNVGSGAFVPFVELDGRMHDNSFRSLSWENPYLKPGLFGLKNTVDYNLRVGTNGTFFGSKFSYRIWLGFTLTENSPYWIYGTDRSMSDEAAAGQRDFDLVQARQTVASLNGELEWKPVGNLSLQLQLHGYLYNNRAYKDEIRLANGKPDFEGLFKIDYRHRKFSFGASARVESVRHWTQMLAYWPAEPAQTIKIPVTVDVGAYVDWHLSRTVTLFAEGHNLADQRLCAWPGFPELGANFTAGVKLTF